MANIVDWNAIKSWVQIPKTWFQEIERRTTFIAGNNKIKIEKDNKDGVVFTVEAGEGGDGKVKVKGTDGSTAETDGGEIEFESGNDSNIKATVEKNGNGVRVILHAYYC